jgi:hypothetical protein
MTAATAGLRFAVPLRPTVGTRPIDESDWLIVDGDRAALLATKERLLVHDHSEVVQLADLPNRIGTEVAELVLNNYRRHHPGVLTRSGGLVTDVDSGLVVDLNADHPLLGISRVVAEDLCVMVDRGGEWVLAGACVCFPSRWSLREKVGRSLDDIHDVVPGYAGPVAVASRRVFDRLTDGVLLRFNWTLLDDPELFQPRPPRSPAAVGPDGLYLRAERQTLRRLPDSGAVLFTIHTSVEPLGQVAQDPDRARTLAASLRSSTPDTRAYKGWAELIEASAQFLEERAGDGASRR